MKKKFIIRLSVEERQDLTNLVRKGKVAAYKANSRTNTVVG